MVRFNLQLFAKSVDDLAKEVIKGNWGNGETRKTKLTNAGYDYSTVQTRVNEMLGVGTKKTNTDTAKATGTNKTGATNTPTVLNTGGIPQIKGVDDSLVNTINSKYTESDELLAQKQGVTDKANAYMDWANNTNIIDSATWAGLTTPYSKSDAVLQAEQLLQSKIDQGYAGTHKEALNNLLNDIMNREDFEYDVDKDQMFQQALASAMGSGKTAMQDTMGQAAALTGGYGSTYATTAGNQAYNAFIQDAYDNLPEYYNMALAAYEAEGQQMLQQYNMLDAADTKEYNQWYDDINLQYQSVRDMVGDEYNQWNANQTMYANTANMQLAENAQIGNNLYNMYNVASSEYENAYAKDYQNWQQSIDSADMLAGMQSSDYWNTEDMNFKKSEAERDQANIDRDFGYRQEQDAITQSNWEKEFDYREGQDKLSQSNWQKEYEADLLASGIKVDANGNLVVDDKYANYINPDDVEVDEYGNIVSVAGYNIAGANGSNTSPAVAHSDVTVSGFKANSGDNFKVKVDGTNYKVENQGKVDDTDTVNRLNTVNADDNQIINYGGDLYLKYAEGYYKIGSKGSNKGYTNLLGALK